MDWVLIFKVVVFALLISGGLFWLRARIAADDTKRKSNSWELIRETLRTLGETVFAAAVVIILFKTPLELTLTERFEKRLEGTFSEKIEAFEKRMMRIFVTSQQIGEQIRQYVINTDFVYSDYKEQAMLSPQSNNVLRGVIEAVWHVKNVTNGPRRYELKAKYNGVDIEAGGVQDSILELKEAGTGKSLGTWVLGKDVAPQDGPPGIIVDVAPECELIAKKITKAFFKTDNEIFAQLKYPCERMEVELMLPDTFSVEYDFKHPGLRDTLQCVFVQLPAVDKYARCKAIIKTAVLPYQGIWLTWVPKGKS